MWQVPWHAISSANAMRHASCLIRLVSEEHGRAVDITQEQTQLLMELQKKQNIIFQSVLCPLGRQSMGHKCIKSKLGQWGTLDFFCFVLFWVVWSTYSLKGYSCVERKSVFSLNMNILGSSVYLVRRLRFALTYCREGERESLFFSTQLV